MRAQTRSCAKSARARASSKRWWEHEQVLRQLFAWLELKDIVRFSLVNRSIFEFVALGGNAPAATTTTPQVTLSFEDRQKIRRQIFNAHHNAALPSLFTHIFPLAPPATQPHSAEDHSRDVLRALLGRAGGLQHFCHERSGKELKLYHPFFYRQLPLRIDERSELPPAIVEPQNVPLPHDLSLADLLQLLIFHHQSLRTFALRAYDACPLPWNTTPSRGCPRDLIGGLCLAESDALPSRQPTSECAAALNNPCAEASVPDLPYQIRVWCPECKYTGADHAPCWLKAGVLLKERLVKGLRSEEERARLLAGWAGRRGGLCFDNLECLEVCGWAMGNFLALLRMLGCSQFPRLRRLRLRGTLIMAPSLTDPKDAWPRPQLSRPRSGVRFPAEHAAHMAEGEKLIKFAQCAALQYSPFSRRYASREAGEYFLGLFNGDCWQGADTFPELESVALRVGNFDDAARWITPFFENCLSFAPRLQTIQLDHSVLQFDAENDPLIRFFSMYTNDSGATRFPKLQLVQIKLVDSAQTLALLEQTLSQLLNRPLRVQARKILVYLQSPQAYQEASLIRQWPLRQRARLTASGVSEEPPALNELSCFSEEISEGFKPRHGLLALCFDAPPGPPVIAPPALDFGPLVSKLLLKHYTPSNSAHAALLRACHFGAPSRCATGALLPCLSTAPDEEQQLPSPITQSAAALRRVDVQLELPHAWQLTEPEAKQAAECEVALLRAQLSSQIFLEHVRYIRVGSCTRLTYGGNNWQWWENLITGGHQARTHQPSAQVGSHGWARESKAVLNEQLLERYQCNHMLTTDHRSDPPDTPITTSPRLFTSSETN